MNIIDENFIDASVYSVKFYCKKNNLEHFRTIVIPFDWDKSQVEKKIREIFREIFNETIIVKCVDWVLDIWIPKSFF